MALFDISFLNPFSSTSGIKLSSFSKFFQGDDSNIIVDKTILENISCQYQIYIKEESIARRTHEGEGCFAREIAFLCGIFTGNHY